MLDFAELFSRDGRYPERLLDIGCGPCMEGDQILAKGIFLTGVDQDGETIQSVRKRLPQGEFITADAAFWLLKQNRKYDAVLLRRPDVIFRSANWHQVFRLLPAVLSVNSRVVVTTPGESEAGLCEKWLSETAAVVKRVVTNMEEEKFIVTAENFQNAGETENNLNNLIQSLSWEDDQPHMVCDLRTGQCSVVTDRKDPEDPSMRMQQ